MFKKKVKRDTIVNSVHFFILQRINHGAEFEYRGHAYKVVVSRTANVLL